MDSRIAEMYTDYLNDYIDRAQALENGERYEDAIREYRALDDEKGNASAYFENLRNDPSQADEFARLSPLYDMLKSIAVGDDTRQRIAADEEKIRERDYSTAEAMERNQQYEEAAAAFCALGDWKDAQARAEANLKTLSEYRRHYDSAAALEEAMDFENAIVAFEALGAFSDAADRAEAARESLESFRSLYEAAERMEAEEQYEAAFTAFTGLGTFADSADRALRVKEKAMEQVREHAYASAEALEEESQFEEAIDAFMALGDYRDSAERITLIREKIRVRDYASAKEALEEDRFQEALALLKTLGDYQDSSALLNEAQTGIRYENALNLALDGNISNALSEFTALADYRDSAVKAGILSNLKLADKAQQIVPGVLIYQFHGLWGLANLNTNVSVPAKYSAITYAEGTQYRELDLLNVFIQGAADEKNYYGYMDLNGSEVIPCRFYAVSDFDEHGRCTVVEAHIVHPNYYYYSRLYFGIMDRDGNVITEPQWQTMGASGNVGSSGHSNWTSSWSSEMFYMNSLYFTVSLPVFTEGRMKVQDTDQGLWGCIDESGRILGDGVKWNGIGDFSDGMAKVKLNGKYGFINADGVQVGDVRWDTVKDFSSGYAGVQENGKWGFIDHGNTLVIPCRYLEVNDFKVNDNGECTCDVKKEDGTWDVINTAGESVLYGN